MTEVKIQDEAHLFRITVRGRLACESVDRVREWWHAALQEDASRRFTVDISELTGFDISGSKLLREMYRHGTYLAARNPFALALLNEISAPEASGPTLVYRNAEIDPPRRFPAKAAVLTRKAAAGE